MKLVLGILMCVAGIALGLYVGLWWAFIGGIVDVIQAVRAPNLDAMNIGIGVAKIVLAGLSGTLCAIALVIPGLSLINRA